jgi:hypothetical protein
MTVNHWVRKRMLRVIAISLCCLFLATLVSIACTGIFLARDWYAASVLSVPRFSPQLHDEGQGQYWYSSRLDIETSANYSDVTQWYEQRGFTCDGACEKYTSLNILGIFSVGSYKRVMPTDLDFSRNPLQITVYEEYYWRNVAQ